MLEPQSRRLLLESLEPPENLRLDWAVGTTYSLDLTALLSAPVAFAFSDWQGSDGRPVLNPLALLKAVRQYADRICLFCQAGRILVPRAYQPLLTDLEESIVEAKAPNKGSFHPKLWFLRYVGEGESVIYRFLCLSRNMTFDRSWDTLLCLEGPLKDRVNAIGRNHPLGQFADALPKMATRPVTAVWKKRIDQLAHDLRRVKFAVPEPFEDVAFHPLGIGDGESWPFPQRVDNLLAISPFVDDHFVEDLGEYEAPMQLVSRPESLAALSAEALEHFEKVWTLDEGADPEAADAEEDSPEVAAEAAAVPEDEHAAEIPLVGLHAKLYVADAGWNAHVWTGSANATRRAFRDNVEFLVELIGKKSRCGVDAILGKARSGGKSAACLLDLLQPYVRKEGEVGPPAAEQVFELAVERLSQQLAAAAPVATCDALVESDRFRMVVRPTRGGRVVLQAGWSLRARPISLPDAEFRTIDTGTAEWSRFEPITLLGLTAFFAFEVTSSTPKLTRRFVLNIPLENPPEHRREAVLRHLLSDRDRVLRFLLLLLSDGGAREIAGWMGGGDGGREQSAMGGLFDSTLLESLLRSLDREPERIDQVARVIDDLHQTPEGQALLPPGLDAVWEPIRQVRRRQLERESAKQSPKPPKF